MTQISLNIANMRLKWGNVLNVPFWHKSAYLPIFCLKCPKIVQNSPICPYIDPYLMKKLTKIAYLTFELGKIAFLIIEMNF